MWVTQELYLKNVASFFLLAVGFVEVSSMEASGFGAGAFCFAGLLEGFARVLLPESSLPLEDMVIMKRRKCARTLNARASAELVKVD